MISCLHKLSSHSAEIPRGDLLKDQPDVLGTQDTLMATVPWGNWRAVLVYERRHAGRAWLRLRTITSHRTKGCWYPFPRFFGMPMDYAEDLANAVLAAARGEQEAVLGWYDDFEKQYKPKRNVLVSPGTSYKRDQA